MARNIHKHIYEYKRDIRLGNLNNALFSHISKTDHNFDFNAATMFAHIHNKRMRQIFEASVILLLPSINTCSEFFYLSSFSSKFVLNHNNILKL